MILSYLGKSLEPNHTAYSNLPFRFGKVVAWSNSQETRKSVENSDMDWSGSDNDLLTADRELSAPALLHNLCNDKVEGGYRPSKYMTGISNQTKSTVGGNSYTSRDVNASNRNMLKRKSDEIGENDFTPDLVSRQTGLISANAARRDEANWHSGMVDGFHKRGNVDIDNIRNQSTANGRALPCMTNTYRDFGQSASYHAFKPSSSGSVGKENKRPEYGVNKAQSRFTGHSTTRNQLASHNYSGQESDASLLQSSRRVGIPYTKQRIQPHTSTQEETGSEDSYEPNIAKFKEFSASPEVRRNAELAL